MNRPRFAFAKKNKKSPVSRKKQCTELLCYSHFVLFQNRERCFADKAEANTLFFGIRGDLEKLTLATYFAQLCCELIPENEPAVEELRLMLNTLHYLENGERSEALLKSIFELRLMTELGMMPDLLMCRSCGVFLPKRLYFSVEEGCFFCADCGAPENLRSPILLRAPVLQAMRHILFADYNRLYQFQLGQENLRALGECTERFVQYHLSLKPRALTFYQSVAHPSAPPNVT